MIWLFYLLCVVNGVILVTLDALPWNSWQFWASVAVMIGSNFAGYCTCKKYKGGKQQ